MFTKWVEIISVKNKVAATIEKELHKKIISKWGTPRILFTDNGKEFVNRIMVKLTQNFGIRHSKADNIAKKLNKKFEGQFFIKTKISPTIYEIKNKKGKSLGNWNVKDIKKYIEKTKETNRNTHRIVS